MSTTSVTKTDTILFRIVRIETRNGVFYRVTARIPGFSMAYLTKPEGGCNFPNRSAALKAAKRRAAYLGLNAKITSCNSRSQITSVR
jgi:hypothetical protein